jgi:hypothetical protein
MMYGPYRIHQIHLRFILLVSPALFAAWFRAFLPGGFLFLFGANGGSHPRFGHIGPGSIQLAAWLCRRKL